MVVVDQETASLGSATSAPWQDLGEDGDGGGYYRAAARYLGARDQHG
jgi:hypothetical protein